MYMFNLNKIHGHIKMLKFQELKLSRYLNEENARDVVNPERIKDITRAHKRVSDNIAMWETKLAAITNAPARPPERHAVGHDDPNKPLVG